MSPLDQLHINHNEVVNDQMGYCMHTRKCHVYFHKLSHTYKALTTETICIV